MIDVHQRGTLHRCSHAAPSSLMESSCLVSSLSLSQGIAVHTWAKDSNPGIDASNALEKQLEKTSHES